jgi:hypothetical protein
VPLAPGGSHKLLLRGTRNGKVVAVSVRVRPSITLSPTSGPAGTRVRVTFRGYRAGEAITLRWYVNSRTVVEITTEITTDGDGTVSYSFRTPRDARRGTHKIEGAASSRASAKFTVT